MQPSLKRYALIAIAAAVATLGLKGSAFWVTGSVGILSDALESLVNLATGLITLYALTVAARPADEDHAYGHTKAEYLASGVEGMLIVLAAIGIAAVAIERLIVPRPLEALGTGAAIAMVATAINFLAARVIGGAARRHDSIALEASSRHLMTDVWTSTGVVAGVIAAQLTGRHRIDPLIALAVAGSIVWTGIGLVRRSVLGLLDTGLPEPLRSEIIQVLEAHRSSGAEYHALRTRQAGQRRFVSFHILVPGEWTVQRGHDLLERIEAEIREAVPRVTVFTHLEPLEDPVSWADTRLERPADRSDGAGEDDAGGGQDAQPPHDRPHHPQG